MKLKSYIQLAMDAARRDIDDMRLHAVGSLGVRTDGTIVRSRNGSSKLPLPEAHAEFRLCDKLDYGTPFVFVARVRKNGECGLAKPCDNCLTKLIQKAVKKIYFTTNIKDEYGVIEL